MNAPEQSFEGDMTLTDQNPEFIEFKRRVKRWIDLDDEIRTLRDAVKVRNNEKKELAPFIIDFMRRNEVSDLNTRNGKLKTRTSMYKKPLNQKSIQSKLVEFFNNLDKGKAAAEYLINNRDKEERSTLTRYVNRKKKDPSLSL